MSEGGAQNNIAGIDSSDVFNPKQTCRNCGTKNDIATTICQACGLDVYGLQKKSLEIEDTQALKKKKKGKHPTKRSLSKIMFDKKIAAAAPTSSTELIVVQNEGMMDIAQLEDFLDDDNVNEGRKDRGRNHNNGDAQNMDNNNGNMSGNRPLFTTLLVIYWLYYLVWFVVGIILTFFSWLGVNEGITVVCMILPSLIMLVLMSRISCLNSVNINQINHYYNLAESERQKYKLMAIVMSILLCFAALLRVCWWIYCIVEYVQSDSTNDISAGRLSVTLVSLLINECGTTVLINLDFLKMSFFEKNKSKQGIFGIINDPYPCLISLCVLVTVQLWILSYGSMAYQPNSQICDWWIAYIFECGLHVIYVMTAMITMVIPMAYGMKFGVLYRNGRGNEQNQNIHQINRKIVKLSRIEQYGVIVMCGMLMLLTFIMALSIFAGFQDAYTWIHLLLLPQLFGIMWALFKLRKLSLS